MKSKFMQSVCLQRLTLEEAGTYNNASVLLNRYHLHWEKIAAASAERKVDENVLFNLL